jgi:YggT family protein
MMTNGDGSQPLILLIEIIFGLYLGLLGLRLIMRWAAWDPSHVAVQFILRLTQSPIGFIRRILPNNLKTIGHWDAATIGLLLTISLAKVTLINVLNSQSLSVDVLFFATLATLFSLGITLFSASILIQAVLSWLGPQGAYHPVAPLVRKMNAPLLKPIQRYFPPIAGFDLAPLIVLVGLQTLLMLILPLLS